jgi:hypothetical protein
MTNPQVRKKMKRNRQKAKPKPNKRQKQQLIEEVGPVPDQPDPNHPDAHLKNTTEATNRKGESCGFHFETHECEHDLAIHNIPTSKDKIEQPELAAHEDMFIPQLGFSTVISGKSGSGKSTLLTNLFTDPRFYGKSEKKPKGWFDKIFLFSPTANGDDVQKALGIPKNHVFTDLDEAPELLELILDSQQSKLDKADGADKVPQYAILFDDIIGDVSFMNERAFTRCFYQVRHVNCTTFICTQHFKRVPRICRLQANFVFFFQGSQSEVEIVVEEFAPPQYSKDEFRQLVNDATANKKFDFLTINMKVGWDKRFRRNLDEFIKLDRFEEPEEEDGGDSSSSDDEGDENYEGDEEDEHDKLLEEELTRQEGELDVKAREEWLT